MWCVRLQYDDGVKLRSKRRMNERTEKETRTRPNNVHHDRRRHTVSTSLWLVDPLSKDIIIVISVYLWMTNAAIQYNKIKQDVSLSVRPFLRLKTHGVENQNRISERVSCKNDSDFGLRKSESKTGAGFRPQKSASIFDSENRQGRKKWRRCCCCCNYAFI